MKVTWLITQLLCFLVVGNALAENSFTKTCPVLQNRAYYEPILADPRAAQTSVLFPAVASSFPYAVNTGSSLAWDISLGAEIPIISCNNFKSADDDRLGVPSGKFGVGLWFPISFHMIEDMGKDPSNPILNVDYRFSGMIKAQYGIGSSSHLGMKFQFGHESTHIGDEFTLGALKAHPNDFLRVNVSYEYYDMGGSFEPNLGKEGRYEIKIRAGDIWLWNPDHGWYNSDLLQPFGKFIALSNRNHEPYAQAELYVDGGLFRGLIASTDIRDRTIYQYVPTSNAQTKGQPEPTQVSINTDVGWRQPDSSPGTFGRVRPTIYIRYYRGVNPNGQFRSQPNFQEFGLGFQFRFW
jgi:hypothetical protein